MTEIKMNSIAVLMTVHNRKITTLECLRHLFENNIDNINIQVYLVNDGCTDGTKEAVKKDFPAIKNIDGDGSLYWNRGMIRAWKEAEKDNPDFYLWLNDDTMLFPNSLSIMMNSYQKTDGNSIICGSTMAIDSDKITYGGRKERKLLIPNGELQSVEWINGNCVLIPKAVKEKIGILDSFFHHSKGDWEYGIRALKSGVLLFIATDYVGRCAAHEMPLPKCYNSKYSLKERLQYLYHPLCPNPKETFYFCWKCLPFGLVKAFLYVPLQYLRVLVPNLFLFNNK